MTLLVCAGVARALTAVPTTFGPAVSSAEVPKKVSRPAGVGLTFAERVAYQRVIEEVRWRRRIWPKDNSQPKPSLDAIASQGHIEQKVHDYLRKSQLVADDRGWPITASELQAEMDRMAGHTRQPDVLRQLFEALGNDPFVIAECLARPILAERVISELVADAKDTSFRAESRNPAARLIGDSTGSFGFTQDNTAANLDNAAYKLPEISASCVDDTWTATTTVSAPRARSAHTVVWTGSEMIIWGGSFVDNGGGHYLDSGARYDPASDSWTTTSTTNAPTARSVHSAVWTGSEMIVWGGYDGTNELNTGGRYNPTTDAWVATSTMNAPVPRVRHTAVWTGSEMIVWGGYGCNANCNLNSGGRYNPDKDSWTTTSTINAPEARWYHTPEWTGSEMIIWGGTNGVNYVNTGGRYNPSLDSWTPTGLVNVPLGRIAHTGVWTGNEMIVWGGVDSTFNDCNTGGRYNATKDSWIATSTTNAPSPRDSHTAVWTNSKMLVWGGEFGPPGVSLDTGGRYSTDTDSWVATSIANAPHGRDSHTVVWTGGEMIVWGGAYWAGNNRVFLNTGGRYCAQPAPTPTATPTATASPTATATATATATPTPRPTLTPRSTPPPRPRPTAPPRP